MANLNIKLVKSLSGRIAKHKPSACVKSAIPLCSLTMLPPGARSPTSVT